MSFIIKLCLSVMSSVALLAVALKLFKVPSSQTENKNSLIGTKLLHEEINLPNLIRRDIASKSPTIPLIEQSINQKDIHVNDEIDEHQNTALHYAASRGNLKLAQLLIKRGADLDVVNAHGNTPLHCAFYGMHLEVAELLIKSGADLNIEPIFFKNSALNPNEQSFLFFERTAKLQAKLPYKGNTPLYSAFHRHIKKLLCHLKDDSHFEQQESAHFISVIRLISWYLHHRNTYAVSLKPENHFAIIQYLKNSYYSSQRIQVLSPLLSWMLTEAIECKSRNELIQKKLQYLDEADEHMQKALVANIAHFFLAEEEITKEFNLNVNNEEKFLPKALEILKNICRNYYNQKLDNRKL